ncbi:MAG: hypD, partial [Clostridiaceae bacterium]|nr:hypD [Clostridiaceae bacterium]
MKFVDEFRNGDYAKGLVKLIQNITDEKINIMEVCGTHTMSIFRYGIRDILPENIKIISGPGCPVCVTPQSYIDTALELSLNKDVIISTFGDMMRVPGKTTSLMKRKGEGADIRIVYSPMDALTLAENNSSKKIVFLSVGFETTTPMTAITAIEARKKGVKNLFLTTTPMTAITAIEARKKGVKNLFFLTAHKIVPPAMKTLVEDKEINIDGFLLPGHVSAVIGKNPYEFLGSEYKIPGVIAGFEPLDILGSLNKLINMINEKDYDVINDYKRIVRDCGNPEALGYL